MPAGLSLSYPLAAADLTLVSLSFVEYFFPCRVEFWARKKVQERQPSLCGPLFLRTSSHLPELASHPRKQLIEYFCIDVSDAVGKLPVKAY